MQVKPDLFSTHVVPTAENDLKEVQMQSGLGVAMNNPLLNVSLDYKLKGSLRKEPNQDQNSDFSQVLATTLQSHFLNRLFDISASIKANQVVRDGGDIYKIQLAPSLHKKLTDLASVDVKYSYILDKPSASAHARETRYYLLGLNGKLGRGLDWRSHYSVNYTNYAHEKNVDSSQQDLKTEDYLLDLNGKLHRGKLQWNGSYKSSDSFNTQDGNGSQSLESIDFKTRYAISPELAFELANAMKHKTRDQTDQTIRQKQYAAGLSWSPESTYSVSLKVNKVDTPHTRQIDYFTSGTFTWNPERYMQFSLGYGDQLIKGKRGVMISTRLELDKN